METVSCKLGPTVQAQSMLSFPISAVREGDATASTGHYSGSATIVALSGLCPERLIHSIIPYSHSFKVYSIDKIRQ